MLMIRPEQPEDIPAIHHVNAIAFGQPNEADLVDALRRAGALTLAFPNFNFSECGPGYPLGSP